MAVSVNHTGWRKDPGNSRLDFYYNGTRIGHIAAAGITSTAAISATTSVAATTTVTGGTGVTATTGNVTSTAGDVVATVGHFLGPAGNVKLGTATAFATTQPVAAVVMGGTSKAGIAPVGAIATCGAVFASDTVVRKIIADGTASNVET